MYQEMVEREGYSKKQVAKIKSVLRKISVARKKPAFRAAVKQFIKETT